MKIEFQCTQCRSVLRLGGEHAGKNARCPACGNIVAVPISNDSDFGSVGNSPRVKTGSDHARSGLTQGLWEKGISASESTANLPPPPFTDSEEKYDSISKSIPSKSAQSPYFQPSGQVPTSHWSAGMPREANAPNPYAFTGTQNAANPGMLPIQSHNDGRFTGAIVLFILSLCSNVICFCGTFLAVILAVVGLILSFGVQTEKRNLAVILNAIALGIAVLLFTAYLLFAFFN